MDIQQREDDFNQLREEFPHIPISFIKCDVSSKNDVESSIQNLKLLYGNIHIFINCAGLCNDLLPERTINVNLVIFSIICV